LFDGSGKAADPARWVEALGKMRTTLRKKNTTVRMENTAVGKKD
jgi:hypothetical protein